MEDIKAQSRLTLSQKIKQLSHDERKTLSLKVQSRLESLLSKFSGTWGAFQSLSDEPQINWDHLNADIEWTFPKVEGLQKLSFSKKVQNWSPSRLGIQEPQDGVSVEINNHSGFCIPGLGFHPEGYRLGRGGGFYDSNLKQFNGVKVGVCFDFCFNAQVPYEDHDLQVDYVVTDQKVVRLAQH